MRCAAAPALRWAAARVSTARQRSRRCWLRLPGNLSSACWRWSTEMQSSQTDVLIVGAGPAGLAAAIELRKRGAGRVLVVDREKQPGGIPRHCHHTGFGLRDLHRVLTGPADAARYVREAEKLGVDIETETSITGWREATCVT